MTSGSTTIDRRYTDNRVGVTDCLGTPYNYVVANLGVYKRRLWSGGDLPPSDPEPAQNASFTYTIWKRRKAPKLVTIKRFRKRKRVVVSTVPTGKGTKEVRRTIVEREPYEVTKTKMVMEWVPRTKTFRYARPKVRRERKMVDHPYTVSWDDHSHCVGRSESLASHCTNGSRPYGFFSTYEFSYAPGVVLDNNTKIKVVSRLRDKIQGESFNLAVSLAEARDSFDTIANSATRIAKSAALLRKGRAREALRTLLGSKPNRRGHLPKDISHKEVTQEWFAGNWLSFQYGVQPLLSDIQAAAAHAAYCLNRPTVKRYRASATRKKNGVIHETPSLYYYGDSWARRSIIAKLTHINEAKLLGLTDPASVLWEKTPWSFVADWFIPVGNFLSALALDSALTGTYVITDTQKVSQRGVGAKASFPYLYSFEGPWSHEHGRMVRTITQSLDVPPPRVKKISEMASWKRAASSAALLTTTFHGIFRSF